MCCKDQPNLEGEKWKWLPVPSIVQSELRGDRRGRACHRWLFFPPRPFRGNSQRKAGSAPSPPSPPPIAHRTSVFKEKDFFSSVSAILGKCQPCLPQWPSFLLAVTACQVSLDRSSVQIMSELVDGLLCQDDCEGAIYCRKGAESYHRCRRGGLRARRPSGLPPASLQCCGETACPRPEGLSPSRLSTKHNTNLRLLRPQFKCPYLFR